MFVANINSDNNSCFQRRQIRQIIFMLDGRGRATAQKKERTSEIVYPFAEDSAMEMASASAAAEKGKKSLFYISNAE
jgi:hypothetical protein